jgi:hypothetical protein
MNSPDLAATAMSGAFSLVYLALCLVFFAFIISTFLKAGFAVVKLAVCGVIFAFAAALVVGVVEIIEAVWLYVAIAGGAGFASRVVYVIVRQPPAGLVITENRPLVIEHRGG